MVGSSTLGAGCLHADWALGGSLGTKPSRQRCMMLWAALGTGSTVAGGGLAAASSGCDSSIASCSTGAGRGRAGGVGRVGSTSVGLWHVGLVVLCCGVGSLQAGSSTGGATGLCGASVWATAAAIGAVSRLMRVITSQPTTLPRW